MSKLFDTHSARENLTSDTGAPRSVEYSIEQRRTLLGIAHEAILSVLEGRPFPATPPSSAALSEPRGVFTTLYVCDDLRNPLREGLSQPSHREAHRRLRGCVGYATAVAPLYRAVAETARAAAFEDSRFVPVRKEEAVGLLVSLSVLSRLFPLEPEAVSIGRHGLVISQGTRRGLLLPQVAAENGWDRETFMEQTCAKAGLPLDAWRKGASITGFTAEVFADDDVADPGVCGDPAQQ